MGRGRTRAVRSDRMGLSAMATDPAVWITDPRPTRPPFWGRTARPSVTFDQCMKVHVVPAVGMKQGTPQGPLETKASL